MVGRTIADRYEILSRLGEGGMGAVYIARQVAMDREVAVKVLHREFLRDESSRKRFVREMQATSAISHPNTVTVYDYGTTEQGEAFLVMELLSGMTLHQAIAGCGAMPTARVVHITQQVSQALASAHDKGIIHRDIKPENIILLDSYGVDDWVKVLDFGIARMGESEGGFGRESLTQTGTVLGTPSYMSPERAMGRPMDHRSDIYAVGVLMYVMATGRTPFESTEPMSVLFKHVSEPVPPLSAKTDEPHPGWMDALIARLMAKEPDDRPDSLHEVVHFLDGHKTGSMPVLDSPLIDLSDIDHDSQTTVLQTRQSSESDRSAKPRTVIRPSSGYARKPTASKLPAQPAKPEPKPEPTPEPPTQADTSVTEVQSGPRTEVMTYVESGDEATEAVADEVGSEEVGSGSEEARSPERTEALQFEAHLNRRPTLIREEAEPEPEKTSIGKMIAAFLIVGAGVAVAAFIIIEMMSGGGLGVTQTTKQNTAAGVASPPVRVGILHSLSGPQRDTEQPVVDAIKLAIEEINGDGGVLGRTIDAFTADGRSDPTHFAAEAERLITKERVSVLFGCWSSAARKAVMEVVERHDHLLVYPAHYEGLEKSEFIIYLGSTPSQQVLPAVKWAFGELESRRFFLIGSDHLFSHAANAIVRDALKTMGAKIVGESYLKLESTDMTKVVGQITRKKPDVILNTMSGSTNVAFVRALSRAGEALSEIPSIAFNLTEQELARLDLDPLEGQYAAWSYFQSVAGEPNHAFVSAFRTKYGDHRVVSDPMEAAYVGVHLWAQSVESARAARPANVRKAMRGAMYDGPGGALRIDATTGHAAKFARIGRIEADGQFKLVYASVEPLQPNPFPDSRTPRAWKAFLSRLYKGWGNNWEAPAQ